VLDLALQNLNPDRARRLLEAGSWPLPMERPVWPIDGVDFALRKDLPEHLGMLPDAPPWLFVRGVLPAAPGVAIIGSRHATRYGLELAERLGAVVGMSGWPVVSGLARGIDAAAHRGCVRSGAPTVAVLGCGIDSFYPKSNSDLGRRILAGGGAVVSEFGPGAAPERWRFPARNRIISGLSGVVVVVEAAAKSGALITANQAVAQGREVVAVPGDLSRATSEGCNRLIRDGAHVLVDVDEAPELIEMLMGVPPLGGRAVESSAFGALPATIEELMERSGDSLAEVMMAVTRAAAAGTVVISEGVVQRSMGK
jgi:DNA processing protein